MVNRLDEAGANIALLRPAAHRHTRERVLEEARSWIGTPYHHRASVKGVGADCLGLIRGVWLTIYKTEPETLPDYSQDWAEATGYQTLLAAAYRHMFEVPITMIEPGDVLLFRTKPGGPARHIGILGNARAEEDIDDLSDLPLFQGSRSKASAQRRDEPDLTLIHAWSKHAVAEVPFDARWQSRVVAAFGFPDQRRSARKKKVVSA